MNTSAQRKKFPSFAGEDRIRTLLKADILDFRTLNDDFQKEIAENGIVLYDQRLSREIFQRIGSDYVKLFKTSLDRIKL